MGMGMAPELHPDLWRSQNFFQMANLTMPNNVSSMKFAQKSVSGFADDGVPHGVGDGSVTPAPGSGSKKWARHTFPELEQL